jgi:hypothetical protein
MTLTYDRRTASWVLTSPSPPRKRGWVSTSSSIAASSAPDSSDTSWRWRRVTGRSDGTGTSPSSAPPSPAHDPQPPPRVRPETESRLKRIEIRWPRHSIGRPESCDLRPARPPLPPLPASFHSTPHSLPIPRAGDDDELSTPKEPKPVSRASPDVPRSQKDDSTAVRSGWHTAMPDDTICLCDGKI